MNRLFSRFFGNYLPAALAAAGSFFSSVSCFLSTVCCCCPAEARPRLSHGRNLPRASARRNPPPRPRPSSFDHTRPLVRRDLVLVPQPHSGHRTKQDRSRKFTVRLHPPLDRHVTAVTPARLQLSHREEPLLATPRLSSRLFLHS